MKTVGEILRTERNKRNRSLDDIAEETKIKKSFLEAIEEDRFTDLPDPIYTRGFVHNYANTLGLEDKEIMPFYRRQVKTDSASPPKKSPPQPIDKPRFKITPGVVLTTAISIAIVVFLATLFWQYQSFAGAPVLIVHQPQEGLIQEKAFVEVSGRTDAGVQILINGQPAQVDSDGSFRLNINLREGINRIRIVAENQLGKQTVVERIVTVKNSD